MRAFAAIVFAAFIGCAWLPVKTRPDWNERIPYSLLTTKLDVWDLTDKLHLRWSIGYEALDRTVIHLPSAQPTWGELYDALRRERLHLDTRTMMLSGMSFDRDGWVTAREEAPAAFIRWL